MRNDFKSDRHAALDAAYPSDKRYCACKQGRERDCQCAYKRDADYSAPWLACVVAVVAVVSAVVYLV